MLNLVMWWNKLIRERKTSIMWPTVDHSFQLRVTIELKQWVMTRNIADSIKSPVIETCRVPSKCPNLSLCVRPPPFLTHDSIILRAARLRYPFCPMAGLWTIRIAWSVAFCQPESRLDNLLFSSRPSRLLYSLSLSTEIALISCIAEFS